MAFLQAGADVNVQDDVGDTPLHKAACAGRKVIPSSRVIIKAGAFVTGFIWYSWLMKSDGQFFALHPEGDSSVTAAVRRLVRRNQRNSSNSQRCDWRWWNHYDAWGYEMMGLVFFSFFQATSVIHSYSVFFFFCAAAERREMRRKEGKLLEAAREGDTATLSHMVWEHPKVENHTTKTLHPELSPPHLRCFCVVYCFSTAQWKRSPRHSLQGLCRKYSITLCSLQGAQAVYHQAAQVWGQSLY